MGYALSCARGECFVDVMSVTKSPQYILMQGVCDALQSRTDRIVTQGQPALSSDTTGLDPDRYLCEEKAGETQEKYCTIVSACVSSRPVYFQSYCEG